MSNSIKKLYDYDLAKTCCKCKSICLKSNFHKNKNMSDGLQPYCISCKKQKQNYNENPDEKENIN